MHRVAPLRRSEAAPAAEGVDERLVGGIGQCVGDGANRPVRDRKQFARR
jgi:hypothetical protein